MYLFSATKLSDNHSQGRHRTHGACVESESKTYCLLYSCLFV